jgi:hypothetical protein
MRRPPLQTNCNQIQMMLEPELTAVNRLPHQTLSNLLMGPEFRGGRGFEPFDRLDFNGQRAPKLDQ